MHIRCPHCSELTSINQAACTKCQRDLGISLASPLPPNFPMELGKHMKRDNRPVFQLPTPPQASIFAEQTQEKSEQLAVEHAQALNAYIAAYLEHTGANIQNLVLMEQRFYAAESITTKYWLEPKPSDHS